MCQGTLQASGKRGTRLLTRIDHEPGVPKLNLGCGAQVLDAHDGWTNMDLFPEAPGVVEHDMTRVPWPFPDGAFHEVLASHVLEHVPLTFVERDGKPLDALLAVMDEAHRVLRPGGRLVIRTPRAGTRWDIESPVHYRRWTVEMVHGLAAGLSGNRGRWSVEEARYGPYGALLDDRLRIKGLGLTVHVAERSRLAARLLARRAELVAILRKEPHAPARAVAPAAALA